MGHTFAEKILAHKTGLAQVVPGQIVEGTPDAALSHDNTAPISGIFHKIGVARVARPDIHVVVLDHACPAPTTKHAQNHKTIREFVAEQGIEHFYDVGRGVCHQVLAEEGRDLGIRVHAICPGGVATDMVAMARPDIDPDELLRREDIAYLVAYLVKLPKHAMIDLVHIRRSTSKPY